MVRRGRRTPRGRCGAGRTEATVPEGPLRATSGLAPRAASGTWIVSLKPQSPYSATWFRDFGLAQRSEPRADFVAEQLRLFPCREMPADGHLVVVDELGVSLLCPTPRHPIELAREDAHCNRERDALGAEEGQLVFPIEAFRRDPGGRQPVVGNVVEHVVSGKALGLTVEDTGDQRQASGVVVKQPGGQANR